MAVNFTEEQKQVIELRNRNILVSAAAGSGKTAVLVERIITRLTKDPNPINIDELLIVTYTEAAAAEMRERIQSAIEKALEDEPENVHLQQQATLIHQAKITTIHGFCLSVIRDYFHTIDLDPGFRIAEDGELKLLKHDVSEELIEAYYEAGDEEFLGFVECYASGKDDRRLEEIILQLYALSRSQLDPEAWLNGCVNAYDISSVEEIENSIFAKEILRETRRNIDEWLENLKFGVRVCESEDGPKVYAENLLSDSKMLSEWRELSSYQEMQMAFSNASWTRLASNRDKSVLEEKLALVKSIREEVKDGVKKFTQQYFFEDVEELQKDMKNTKGNMRVLARLVNEFAHNFEEKKRSKNLIDFEDMERFALKILTESNGTELVPSSVAKELQDKFAEVMIDEYQDSNLMQEAILTSVSKISQGIHNVFMVGDVKQSIYKFRLSRPELFMEKFHTYSVESSDKQRIDLHKNFRSRKEVLDSTNFVFEQIMTEGFGGIEYDDKAALYLGADYTESKNNETEILLIEEEGLLKKEQIQLEAIAVAKAIKKLIGTHQVFDRKKGGYRPATYGDMVILTRSLAGWSDIFADVLGEEGIPTYTNSREGYFQTREIKLLLDYLRILDNPYQDIPFTAVLASMFAGLNDEELAIVKSSSDEKFMYKCVQSYLENGESLVIKNKLEKFVKCFCSFREKVPYTSIHVLLWKILDETGYGDYVAALPGGIQRAANLEMLLSKAVAFESTSYKGLFNFVRYMEQLHKYDVDYGEANLGDDQIDAVSLMSIHKSKGLEFPIVFLVGMGKQFNTQDARSAIVTHSDLGIGLDAIDPIGRTKVPTLLKRVIQNRITFENAAEELRVLYVAMTRAKEKLIMTSYVKNLEERLRKLGKMDRRNVIHLSYGELTKANCYLDWVLPALYRNKCMVGLLNVYGLNAPFYNDLFQRDVSIIVKRIGTEQLEMDAIEEMLHQDVSKYILDNWDTEKVYDAQMKQRIEEQISYVYPMESYRKIKQKMSVSELKKRAYEQEMGEEIYKEEEVIPLLPNFLQKEQTITGALRGTAYHKVLELLDFTKSYTEELLQQEVNQFVASGYMDEAMAEVIDCRHILRFLESQVGKRMHLAGCEGKLHAEQPFVLGVSAKDVYGEECTNETVLVQGIIDVYFEENGELVVLDYKTDRVSCAAELVEKYHAQLEYYAQALERLTGKPVKEKIIYSFALHKEIEV